MSILNMQLLFACIFPHTSCGANWQNVIIYTENLILMISFCFLMSCKLDFVFMSCGEISVRK